MKMIAVPALWGVMVLILAPVLAVAIGSPPQVQVLTPDEALRTIGFQTSFSVILSNFRDAGSELGQRFLASRGGDVVRDVNNKTGVDLVKFFQFVLGVIYYLFVEIYAVIIDIATRFGS